MPRLLSAYHYSFESTGVDRIEAILEAVANAGMSFHNTEDWNTVTSNGQSPVHRIQEAANSAANAFRRTS